VLHDPQVRDFLPLFPEEVRSLAQVRLALRTEGRKSLLGNVLDLALPGRHVVQNVRAGALEIGNILGHADVT
jgi:hypothetical protein